MSLMMLAIEYLLLHTIFETMRKNDEKSLKNEKQITFNMLSNWKPLSEDELQRIRSMTS